MPADDALDVSAPADPALAPTNPAQAAEHSTSEPAAPPASSDLADAPRPRRRALGPAFRRAASTGFLLGSLAAHDNEVKIKYTITEDEIENYKTDITGDATGSYTVIAR